MSENFLSRWTRRKRAVRAAALAERAAPAVSARAPLPEPDAEGAEADLIAPQTGPEARPPEPEPADDPVLGLPSLEALTAETDLAPFLRAGVPAVLRNAALRRMWSLDPAIRDFVSEAREYAYDWNSPGGVPGLGPLLPSDDVQAMLGRLLGGAAKATPASAETPDSPPDGGDTSGGSEGGGEATGGGSTGEGGGDEGTGADEGDGGASPESAGDVARGQSAQGCAIAAAPIRTNRAMITIKVGRRIVRRG